MCLLREILGDDLREEEFVRTQKNVENKYLTTANLPKIIDAWVERNHHACYGEQRHRYDNLCKCIMLAFHTLLSANEIPGLNGVIISSIASVAETMAFVVQKTLVSDFRSLPTLWKRFCDGEDTQAQLVANGCCPTDAAKWRASAGGFEDLFYLGKLKQPILRNHGSCTGDSYTADRNDMSNNTAHHRCQTKDCGTLQADSTALNRCFDKGLIGLLNVRGKPIKRPRSALYLRK